MNKRRRAQFVQSQMPKGYRVTVNDDGTIVVEKAVPEALDTAVQIVVLRDAARKAAANTHTFAELRGKFKED